MIFLNGALLAFLAALGLPLLLHLLHPGSKRQLTIPTLRFLKAVASKRLRSMRLRRLWLLLLRTLILLCLILAFARPLLRPSGVISMEGGSLFLLLDDSYSTRQPLPEGGILFDSLRAQAKEIVKRLPDGQEMRLLLLSSFEAGSQQASRSRMLQSLDEQQPSWSGADLRGAFQVVGKEAALLRDASSRLLLLTSGISVSADSLLPGLPSNMPCRLQTFHLPLDGNLSLLPPRLLTKQLKVNAPLQILFEKEGDSKSPSASLEVQLNGERISRLSLATTASAPLLKFQPEELGPLDGLLRLSGDSCPLDNERRFVLTVPEAPRLKLFCEHPRLRTTLQAAMEAGSRKNQSIDLEFGTLRNGLFPGECEVAIIVLEGRPPVGILPALLACKQAGMAFIMLPGSNPEMTSWNPILEGFDLPACQVKTLEPPLPITQWDLEHPLLQGLVREGQDFEHPVVKKILLPNERLGRDRLAWTGEHSLMITSDATLLWTTSLLPQWSDLHRRGLVAPVLRSTVHQFSGQPHLDDALICGQSSERYFPGTRMSDRLELKISDQRFFLTAGMKDGFWNLPALPTPGFVSLFLNGTLFQRLAVNPPLESLGQDLPNVSNLSAATGCAWGEAVEVGSNHVVELELLLLLLACGLLGLELLLSRGGKV
jgi:hypothetical protein